MLAISLLPCRILTVAVQISVIIPIASGSREKTLNQSGRRFPQMGAEKILYGNPKAKFAQTMKIPPPPFSKGGDLKVIF
jgi:hypothetical protein